MNTLLNKLHKNENTKNIILGILFISVIFLLFSFFAPYFFTNTRFGKSIITSEETGLIGDTMGGIMNPFIAIAGISLTFLAFYIQYEANKQVQNQFKVQQFESQFYEMLKLHRENITEMKINGYDFEEDNGKMIKFEKSTEGRKLFVVMKKEFECLLALYSKDNILDEQAFHKCYKLFFSGLDKYSKDHPNEENFTKLLYKARKNHENPNENKIKTNKDRKVFINGVELYFNYKPFSGHSQRLGHYFRHLYLIVKSIVNSDIITDYHDKMKYLRVLRAQLSNHEQILLFYNWLSHYGDDWENDNNKFFSEYCMVHNLWYDTLFDNVYIENKVNDLRIKPVIFRKGKMFEID